MHCTRYLLKRTNKEERKKKILHYNFWISVSKNILLIEFETAVRLEGFFRIPKLKEWKFGKPKIILSMAVKIE